MNRDQAPRTLTTGVTVPGDAAAMTVALCTAACQSRNFLYAGLEYAQVKKTYFHHPRMKSDFGSGVLVW